MRLSTFASLLICTILLWGCLGDSDKQAILTLEIKDISFEEKNGRNVFNHSRVFTETNGVDLTITRGKICVESKNTCVDAFLKYKVKGNEELVQENHHVATRQGNDSISFEYWALDENGFEHKLIKTLDVKGQTATVR